MTRRVGIIVVDFDALDRLLAIPPGQKIIGIAPQTAEEMVHRQFRLIVEGHGMPHVEVGEMVPHMQFVKEAA